MNNLILRRIIVACVGTLIVVGIGYSLKEKFASREKSSPPMSFRERAKTVQATPVSYQSREISISNMGRVLSENAVDLIAEVQGEMRRGSVPIKRGQRFRQGQVLFRIDDEEARLSLYAQKSNFITAIAGVLPDLRLDLPDAYPIWQTYFDSLSVEKRLLKLPAVNSSQEKVFFSTRNIINQYYTIKSAEERLSKYIVRAPFSGSFLDVLVEAGSVVNTGTQVARIARSNRLEIELPVRANDLGFVKRGMRVKLFSPTGESLPRGEVTRIGSVVDPTTQSVNIYIRFSPNQQILEGQYLRVEIPGTRIKDVMEIPRMAVYNQNEVFVVADSVILARKIQVEKLNNETLYFTGLPEGEMVVTEGLVNAYDNMPVQVAGKEQNGSQGADARKAGGSSK